MRPFCFLGRSYQRLIILAAVLTLVQGCGNASSANPTPTTNPNLVPSAVPANSDTFDTPKRQLGFIYQGNVWMSNLPDGELTQLTDSNDVLAFAWSPDGEKVATFNGHDVCFVQVNGSSAAHGGTGSFCIGAAVTGARQMTPLKMLWSPDQRRIVIAGVGMWLIVPLEDPSASISVEDPGRLGVNMVTETPGTVSAGLPLFLADNTLIGTFTHTAFCGSEACTYRLFRFDDASRLFTPYTIKGLGEERWENLTLSNDGHVLANFGNFRTDCSKYSTYVDIVNLENGGIQSLQFNQEAFEGMALSPDGSRAVIAQGAVCQNDTSNLWAVSCGLSSEFEVYPMQLWKMETTNPRTDSVPGLEPIWSPDGGAIAFRSCLTEPTTDQWQPIPNGPPWIFIMNADATRMSILPVYEGDAPAWRPGVQQ